MKNLTIKAVGKDVKITLQRIGKPAPLINTLQFKIDNGQWTYWNIYDETNPAFLKPQSLSCGQQMQIKSTLSTFSSSEDDYFRFNISDEVTIDGSIMSLVNDVTSINNDYQFYKCFEGCQKILAVSQDLLPATKLTQSCYEKMFENCYQLLNPPSLPANKLANKCYKDMFKGCINLISTPSLPAVNLVFKCYFGMFEGCINLRTPSEIFAQKLATKACSYMFYGCKKIRVIKTHFKQWLSNGTEEWLTTQSDGTFIKPNSLEEEYNNSRIPRSFKVVNLEKQPLTFIVKNKKDTASITLVQAGKPNLIDLYYSLNYQTWTKYIPGRKLILKYGDVVQFRNVSPFFSIDEKNYYQFVMTGELAAYGFVQSLINFRSYTCGVFTKLFDNCRSLLKAPQFLNTQLIDRCYDRMYRNCTSLIEAPVLIAKQLKNKCYYKMFEGCTSLISTPFLPAMKLANNCYEGMFKGCTNLTQISELPAYKLYPECYKDMFNGCQKLTEAPKLESFSLATGCYLGMFKDCKSLTIAPELPAINLVANCYMFMFSGCENLTSAPDLPAVTLAENCYCVMFKDCTSLTNSPLLPAKEIALGSYENMFEGCTSLSSVTAYFKHWSKCQDTFRWLKDVAQEGTFYKSEDLLVDDITRNCHTIPETWQISGIVDISQPLTFTSVEQSEDPTKFAKITLRQVGNPQQIKVKYKVDDMDWYIYQLGTEVVLDKNHKVSFKSETETFSQDEFNYYQFIIDDGAVEAEGSVNSLIGTDELKPWIFARLFENCHSLVKAPQLDSLVLESNCYYQMFYNCIGLTSLPDLPARVLAPNCYQRMFYNCNGLTSIELPNVIMDTESCKQMFGSCTNLQEAMLPSKFIANGCYDSIFANCEKLNSVQVGFTYWNSSVTNNWLNNVPISGIFKKSLVLKDVRGTNAIPQGWTVDVSKVTDIPLTFKFYDEGLIRLSQWGSPKELNKLFYRINTKEWLQYKVGNIITLQKDDIIQFRNYDNFFNQDNMNYYHFEFKSNGGVDAYGNIMSLVNFSEQITEDYQFAYLFVNCKNLIKAPILPAKVLKDCCYYNMFYNTCIEEAPKLQAENIEVKCYLGMFMNCNNLTTIPYLPATQLKRCCYRNMFRNCLGLTEIDIPSATFSDDGGNYAHMFNGCSNLSSVTVHFEEWDNRTRNNPTNCWLANTATFGTFNKPYDLEDVKGENNIPEGWQVVDINAPEQPEEPTNPDDPIDPEIGG